VGVWGELKATGLPLDTVAYNAVLGACEVRRIPY
jgi:hypothetical protein